jgi:C-terminal processing protease CtpA/Prc
MRLHPRLLTLALLAALPCFPQMTLEQRLFDFEYLAAQFAKFYGPYEWKRDVIGFDLYDLKPWLTRIRAAKSDLDYYEIASEYVASLQDTHSIYILPSNFAATIGITVDTFDGKYLIEAVNRTQLPAARYPFMIGDEIVSIDGKPAEEVAAGIAKYRGQGNPRAAKRFGAAALFSRSQQILPRAHELGDNATVVVRRQSGELETYEIPWQKRGAPLIENGPLPTPMTARAKAMKETPSIPELLRRVQRRALPETGARIIGLGSRTPFFTLPQGFQRRLGTLASHFHFSGTYLAEGKRIGYLRIPNFSPANEGSAYIELVNEIAYLEQNTDGLVVDVARNSGGGCYGQDVAQLLIPRPFLSISDEIRPSRFDLVAFESALNSPPPAGAEQWQIDLARAIYLQLAQAYSENRGRTGPIPICALDLEVQPLQRNDGSVFAYTKPLIVLTDELTISWGDSFAQVLSDAKRGPLFGYRTNGACGSVNGFEGGFYAEGYVNLAISLGLRNQTVQQPGFPSTRYYENVGIWPDIPYDVMTAENLTSGYAPYVQAFTKAIVDEINREVR